MACWNRFFWFWSLWSAYSWSATIQITCEHHLCGLNSPTWFRCRNDLVNPQLGANWFSSKAAVGYLSRANKSLHVFPIHIPFHISNFLFKVESVPNTSVYFCLFHLCTRYSTRRGTGYDLIWGLWYDFICRASVVVLLFTKRDDTLDINK